MYVLWPLRSLMILIIINSLTIIVDEDLTLQYLPSKVSLFALVFLLIYCCSIPQLYPTLSNPMDCNMPDFPVLFHLLEYAQTHVHWYHQTILSSVIPFSYCLQSFPVSGSFLTSWLFASGDQSIGALYSCPWLLF